VNESPIEAVMNLYIAALTILEYEQPAAGLVPGLSRVTAAVRSSLFDANERGLSFVGQLGSVSVDDCTFAGNAAMHAGAGLLIHVLGPSAPGISVRRCRFLHNAAGSVDMDAFAAYADEFRVHDNEVRTVYGVAPLFNITRGFAIPVRYIPGP